MFCVAFIFFSIGAYFWYLGAWPVFGFIGLDVGLLYYAFKINYKSGEIFETLKIKKKTFLVTRNFPSGKQQSWSLEPYWASVELNSQKRSDNHTGTFFFKLITKNITKLAIKMSKKL